MEKLVTFETAELAKELGFLDIRCSHYYVLTFAQFKSTGIVQKYSLPFEIGSEHIYNNISVTKNQPHIASAPTQSQLQKWLRKEHNIDITIMIKGEYDYKYHIHKDRNTVIDKVIHPQSPEEVENLYELALEQGLIENLKLIKNAKINS